MLPTVEELVPAAKAWIKANPDAHTQPWDAKGYKIPGGTPSSPALAAILPAFPALRRSRSRVRRYPAPRAISWPRPSRAPRSTSTPPAEIEGRYFVELVTGQVAKNMIQAFFFDLGHINSGGSRPDGYDKTTFKKVVVLGAGMMGAAIAYVCAKAGIEVVLKDVTLEAAQRGKAYSESLEAKALSQGPHHRGKIEQLLARIHPTADAADAAGADLVIEAVFEDPVDLKHKVFAEIEPPVAPDALLGSNTSTLPITELATGVSASEDFIGLHFFSPVDKMPLLEIIRGEKTSDDTLAKALDLAMQIGKTPIVVNDSRGFFTSRVIGTFINEALAMLGEGVSRPAIEHAGSQAGYPAPPLQLSDELNLELMAKIAKATRQAVEAAGADLCSAPGRRRGEQDDRAGPAEQARGQGFLRVRRRQAHPAVAGATRHLQVGRVDPAAAGHDRTDAVHRGAGDPEMPRRRRAHLHRRREHRLDHGYRLPAVDGRYRAVHRRIPRRQGRFRGACPRARRQVRRPVHPAGVAAFLT